MVTQVTDTRSNPNDQIAHAARVLQRSDQRLAVFRAIYAGKKLTKSVSDLMSATGLTRKQVLTAGKALADNHIVSQGKDSETTYEKDAFYSHYRDRIIALARDPAKLSALPTKTNPRGSQGSIQMVVPRSIVGARAVTIDEINSFKLVKSVRVRDYAPAPLDEKAFKRGMQAVLNEDGEFKDWGGEKNDLWTTRLTYRGRRRSAAFAFKGKGTSGKLVPKKMGKNGDQIQRLFQAPADFFFVQYWREIDQSVVELVGALATAKSVTEDRDVFYCVIDGRDSQRLMRAYPKKFGYGG